MKKLSVTGVGTQTLTDALLDRRGTGKLALQARVTGTATFRVAGRLAPDAPWADVKASGSVSFLDPAAPWVPYLQLDVTAGTGTVELWIAET